jgi:hypothetical protein
VLSCIWPEKGSSTLRFNLTTWWFNEGMSISQKHSLGKFSKKKPPQLFSSIIICILENIVLSIFMEFIHLSISFVPFCFSLRLYRFVGYLLFPFCIKEEYKTGDGSTNRVADQQYIVKQNVHKFSPSPFLLSKTCS